MHASPWKTLSSKIIYDNPWITVQEDQVLTPAKTKGIYGKVCLKNKAIGILPVDDRGNTWLVGQFRYTLNEYSWEIPMGGGPTHETDLESAKRELKEETGLVARKWVKMPRVHTSNCVTDEVGTIFVATDLEQQQSDPEETEQLAVKRLALTEAIDMAKNGAITDAISVIALLRVMDFLDN